MSYVATHEIDERPVHDHKTGGRLAPHLVGVGLRTECEARIRHQLFDRVPIALARGKKVRCQWLDGIKEGADGPLVRSRLVAMEVAHGIRFDTFAGTAPIKCIKIIISRAASIKNTKGGHSRVLALHDISVAFWHALLPEDVAMYPPRCEEEAGYMWQNEASDVWDETCIASLPRAHERRSRRSRLCIAQGMSPSFFTALRRTRWLQYMATTSSQKDCPRS